LKLVLDKHGAHFKYV
jgi:hypothetical protein